MGLNRGFSGKSGRKRIATDGKFIFVAFLIQVGGVKKEIFFIQKGLVRAYKINERGDEITTSIRWENQIVASPDIILFNQPSQLYYETFEPTDVFCFL